MIPNKIRESRRVKALKLPKNLERLYKEGKCCECAVVVTRMDFAKILGKFTKVKIQYESSTIPKTKQASEVTSPNSNARLKSNENGMVLIHRSAYNQHPVKELTAPKKNKTEAGRLLPNVLKENNRLKKPILKDKNSNYDDKIKKNISLKKYGIIFEDPLTLSNNNEVNCKISLTDLLSQINDNILPSEDWCIDFFPKKGEPKDDKVYDRIAAELEDLMYSEKPVKPEEKVDTAETKVDEFPSIMDILNDNSNENKTNDQSSSTLEFKSNLESSDVEAMLLGKTNPPCDSVPPAPMEVDSPDVSTLIEDVNQFTVVTENTTSEQDNKIPASTVPNEIENPHSPSILDEALQNVIGEHLPCKPDKHAEENVSMDKEVDKTNNEAQQVDIDKNVEAPEKKVIETIADDKTESKDDKEDVITKKTTSFASLEGITHLVFKKTKDGACYKTVTCPKNLKYEIEINGKSVEFIGAPKYISSLEDLQVLLQIVNESELHSLYVMH